VFSSTQKIRSGVLLYFFASSKGFKGSSAEELDGLLKLARVSNRKDDLGVPGLEGDRGADMLLPEGEPGVVGGADDVEGPALALSASDKRNSTNRLEKD